MSKKPKSKRHEPSVRQAPDTAGAQPARLKTRPAEAAELPWWRDVGPALLLAVVILVRPWCDGLTFPFQNAYFVIAIAVIVTGWGIGALVFDERVRCARPLALFAGFLLVAAVMGLNSIQPDATCRNLLWWAGHFGVFLIATNALRTNLATGIVIGAFAVSSMVEAVFGVLHLHYILPFTRMIVNLDHNLIAGMAPMGQIENRLESNRAFGSFLFPNALAAFMILGIPYAIGAARRGLIQLRAALAPAPESTETLDRDRRKLVSAGVGLVTWFAMFVPACLFMFRVLAPFKYYTMQTVAGRQLPVSDPLAAHVGAWIWWVGVAPLIPAAITLLVTRRFGWQVAWPAIRVVCAAILGVTELVTLALTYSRGGMLGLLVGIAAGAFLLWFARRHNNGAFSTGILSRILVTASVVLLIAAAARTSASHAETNPPSNTAPAAQQSPARQEINVQGSQRNLADTLDPTSLRLRLSYWETGWNMVKDHFFTGVGLGNFGTAYPVYQRLGSGDSKMAHNDYLQALCETGVFGFALFIAFWAYFVIAGARRIVAENVPAERWMLAGLYAGVIAFLVHSAIDFNFQNTSLAFYVYLLAGVFYARAGGPDATTPQRGMRIAAPLLVLVVAWVVIGVQTRLWLYIDPLVENRQEHAALLASVSDFLNRTQPATFDPQKPPRFSQPSVAEMIPSLADQQDFAKIMLVVNETTARYLKPGEAIPKTLQTKPLIEVRDAAKARAKMSEAVEARIARLQAADAHYPHSPLLAGIIYQWCELKVDSTQDAEERKRWILESLTWAEESVRRNPMDYWFRGLLGRALFQRAGIEPSSTLAIETLRRGLDQYRQAATLYPTSQDMWAQYSEALEKAGAAFQRTGDTTTGGAMAAEGKQAKERAKEIKEYKERTHTGATG